MRHSQAIDLEIIIIQPGLHHVEISSISECNADIIICQLDHTLDNINYLADAHATLKTVAIVLTCTIIKASAGLGECLGTIPYQGLMASL